MHTSFRNLANAASLSLALMSTYTLPTSGFVLKIFSIRTDAEQATAESREKEREMKHRTTRRRAMNARGSEREIQ
jgi:hypothetical protein